MGNFAVIIVCLIIGVFLRHNSSFSKDTGTVLNLFVLYISLPSLILLNIPRLAFNKTLLVPSLMPWVMLLISVIIVLALSKIFHFKREITGALLLVVPLGNTSFFGVPMVDALFGKEMIPYAIIYDQLGSFLILATYGSVIISIYGNDEGTLNFNRIIKKVVTFPPFIALVCALLMKIFTYPRVMNEVLELLATTLIPLVMVAVGFQLKLRMSKNAVQQMCVGLSVKLLLAPIIALTLCRLLGLKGEVVDVSIIESAMPPMVSAGALAILANLAPNLVASVVGWGTILSFITVPMIYYFL